MSRVWAYIISKELSDKDLQAIEASGKQFVSGWTAHENKLSATFEIFKKRIILVKVNEDYHGASGCSIDKLTRFIKELEKEYSAELMNRLLVALKDGEEIKVVHSSTIKELLKDQLITEETIVYNTSAANQRDLENWEEPLKNTWLRKYLQKV